MADRLAIGKLSAPEAFWHACNGVPVEPLRVVQCEAMRGGCFHVVFNDGLEGVISQQDILDHGTPEAAAFAEYDQGACW